MIDQARLDALDPLTRADFDAAPVRRWRVTWPDGASEIVEGHMAQPQGDGGGLMAFSFKYLGAHRVVNLHHARDVEQLPD